jgi:hypothetical protein
MSCFISGFHSFSEILPCNQQGMSGVFYKVRFTRREIYQLDTNAKLCHRNNNGICCSVHVFEAGCRSELQVEYTANFKHSEEYKHKILIRALRLKRYFIFKTIFMSHVSTGSRDRAVGIQTRYGLDDRVVGVRTPVGARSFSSPSRPDRFWGPPSLYATVPGLFPWG